MSSPCLVCPSSFCICSLWYILLILSTVGFCLLLWEHWSTEMGLWTTTDCIRSLSKPSMLSRGNSFKWGNIIIQSWMDMCKMVLWRCLSHSHSLCEGHSQSAQDVWARLVPKDGGATTSLGHVLPSDCSGAVVSTCLIRGPCVAEVPIGSCSFTGYLWEGLALHSLSASHTEWGAICCFSSGLKKAIPLVSPCTPHAPVWW